MQAKHLSKYITAAEQVKINELLKKHGVEYYGFYWFVIDRMMNEPTFQLPFEQYYFDYIDAELYGGNRTHVRTHVEQNRTHVQHMLNTCSSTYKLFTIRDGYFYSPALRSYMENQQKIRRHAGQLSGRARRSKVLPVKSTTQPELPLGGGQDVDNVAAAAGETVDEKNVPIYTSTVYKERRKRIVKEKQPAAAVVFPDDVEFNVGSWPREKFIELYLSWLKYKRDEHRFQYKSATTIANNIIDLYELSSGNFEHARLMIRKAMSNRWKGFFKLTDQDIAESKHESTTTSINDKFKDKD